MKSIKDYGVIGASFVLVLFAYGWVQKADEQAAQVELARAKQQGYHAGYSKGSNAGLAAMYKACTATVGKPCDAALAQAVVAYADEVR